MGLVPAENDYASMLPELRRTMMLWTKVFMATATASRALSAQNTGFRPPVVLVRLGPITQRADPLERPVVIAQVDVVPAVPSHARVDRRVGRAVGAGVVAGTAGGLGMGSAHGPWDPDGGAGTVAGAGCVGTETGDGDGRSFASAASVRLTRPQR